VETLDKHAPRPDSLGKISRPIKTDHALHCNIRGEDWEE
jgi:hypothetical protein